MIFFPIVLLPFLNFASLLHSFLLPFFSKSTLKFIPSILNLCPPHESFHLVLIDCVLCFLEPNHISCVLSKFIFRPDILANLSSSARVQFNDWEDPSRKIDVSSAN